MNHTKMLTALLVSTCIIMQLNIIAGNFGSFARRYGADSIITNIPLYFKPHFYEKESARKQKGRVEKKQKKSVATAHQSQEMPSKKSRQTTRTMTTAHNSDIQAQKAELEREKARLQKELASLEKKKFALNGSVE